jgi:hypothetical protein
MGALRVVNVGQRVMAKTDSFIDKHEPIFGKTGGRYGPEIFLRRFSFWAPYVSRAASFDSQATDSGSVSDFGWRSFSECDSLLASEQVLARLGCVQTLPLVDNLGKGRSIRHTPLGLKPGTICGEGWGSRLGFTRSSNRIRFTTAPDSAPTGCIWRLLGVTARFEGAGGMSLKRKTKDLLSEVYREPAKQ